MPRQSVDTAALNHPASIVINTEGAFIDEDGTNPQDKRNRSQNIHLPNQVMEITHLSLDIGGSLAKVVTFTANSGGKGGRLNFENFQTSDLDSNLGDVLSPLAAARPKLAIATGGGSIKYYDRLKEVFQGVQLNQVDEMECLTRGASFLMSRIPNEVFSYNEKERQMEVLEAPLTNQYPHLLVNIGSGVSILKLNSPTEYERIGGSSLGGGTLWGLLAMLTPAKSYDEMLDLAMEGDNHNVDMLVGDIYGSDYPKIGLKASTIASSFAKAFTQPHDSFNAADMSRSLLYAVSNNIGQLAYLHARYHNVEHIYFAGSYIRGHPQTIHTLAYAIQFWSRGEKTAYFFRHEGYLGALGAFLTHADL